jgi:hypothetical protein
VLDEAVKLCEHLLRRSVRTSSRVEFWDHDRLVAAGNAASASNDVLLVGAGLDLLGPVGVRGDVDLVTVTLKLTVVLKLVANHEGRYTRRQ